MTGFNRNLIRGFLTYLLFNRTVTGFRNCLLKLSFAWSSAQWCTEQSLRWLSQVGIFLVVCGPPDNLRTVFLYVSSLNSPSMTCSLILLLPLRRLWPYWPYAQSSSSSASCRSSTLSWVIICLIASTFCRSYVSAVSPFTCDENHIILNLGSNISSAHWSLCCLVGCLPRDQSDHNTSLLLVVCHRTSSSQVVQMQGL